MKTHFLKKIYLAIYMLLFIVVNAQHIGTGKQEQEPNSLSSGNLGQALGYSYDTLKGNWIGGGTAPAGWSFTMTMQILGQLSVGETVATVFYTSHEGCEGELKRSQELTNALVLEDFGVVSSNCQPTKMYISYENPIMIIDYYNPYSGEYLYQARLQRQ